METGNAAVAAAEAEMVQKLQKIEDSQPKDLARYEFVLKQAVDTTQDSYELSKADVAGRAAEITSKDKKEKDELEEQMTPEEKKQADAEEAKKDTAPKKKAPSCVDQRIRRWTRSSRSSTFSRLRARASSGAEPLASHSQAGNSRGYRNRGSRTSGRCPGTEIRPPRSLRSPAFSCQVHEEHATSVALMVAMNSAITMLPAPKSI